MKKVVCGALLSAAALLGSCGADAAAAANPFSDVPADHWAYDAVAQLAADGVIEGYGDGTYRGEKSITRYEMAQMVAKGMARMESADARDKALLDRLAAEFADELSNLGVRVDNLEQRIDNVRWGGEMRYVHLTHRDENAAGSTDENTVNLLQLRLLPVATINDHWKVRARLTGTIKLKEDTVSNGGSVALSYIYADGNYGKLRIQAGKMLHFLSYSGDGIVADSWFSGAILTYGDKTKLMVEGGRWNMDNAALSISGRDKLGGRSASDYTAKHYGIGIDHATGKLQAGIAYRYYDSDIFRFLPAYRDNGTSDKAGILSVGGKYSFTKNVALAARYAKNLEADNYNQSVNLQLNYKGSNVAKPGSWGLYAAYRHLGGYSTLMPTAYEMHRQTYKIRVDGGEYGTKGWVIGASYAPMKNTNIDIAYFRGKSLRTDRDASSFYTRMQMFW